MKRSLLFLLTMALLQLTNAQNQFVSLAANTHFPSAAPATDTLRANLKVKGVNMTEEKDDNGKVVQRTETTYEYSVPMKFIIMRPMLNRIIANQQDLAYCTDGSKCILASGSSNAAPWPAPAQNATVKLYYDFKKWSLCGDEMKLTYQSSGDGELTDYSLNATIAVINRNGLIDDVPAVPLTETDEPEAVQLTNKNFYVRLIVSPGGIYPNINQSAPREKAQYFDCGLSQWQAIENVKYTLSVPKDAAFEMDRQQKRAGYTEVVKGPILPAQPLLTFFKKPTASKSFEGKGSWQETQQNMQRTSNIEVKLDLFRTAM